MKKVLNFSQFYPLRAISIGIAVALGTASVSVLSAPPQEVKGGHAGSVSSQQQQQQTDSHVGYDGTASYRVPLGRIAASYNSQSGWSVGSFSQIGRSARHGAPGFTDQDIFTLDGQELVCDSSISDCAATGSNLVRNYHTVGGSTRGIYLINPGTSNAYWKVVDKNGSEKVYDTKVGNATNPSNWAISHSEDKFQNRVEYHYNTNRLNTDGRLYLKAIGSGKAGVTTGHCTVLNNALLPAENQVVSYRDGQKKVTGLRVSVVTEKVGCNYTTGAGGTQKARFVLDWEQGDKSAAQRLSGITPYDADDVAQPGYRFDYHEMNAFWKSGEDWGNPEGESGIDKDDALTEYGDGEIHAMLVDMNGDGLPDRVRGKDNEQIRVWLNLGDGFESSGRDWWLNPSYTDRSDPSNHKQIDIGVALNDNNTFSDLIDMDGDGLPDRVIKKDDTAFYIFKNTGSGFESSPLAWSNSNPEGVDFNQVRRMRKSYSHGTVIDLIDMNGDGLPDRVFKDSAENTDVDAPLITHSDGQAEYRYVIWFNEGDNFSTNTVYWDASHEEAYNTGGLNIRHSINVTDTSRSESISSLMDMNGDGLPDRVIKKGGESFTVFLNTGNGFDTTAYDWGGSDGYALTESNRVNGNDNTRGMVLDVNGDGLPDRVIKPNNGGEISVRLNTGRAFSDTPLTYGNAMGAPLSLVTDNDSVVGLMDIDGDRMADRVRKCGDGGTCSMNNFMVRSNGSVPNEVMLSQVTLPTQGKLQFGYAPLKLGPAGDHPGYNSKRWLISTVVRDDAQGNVGMERQARETKYHYTGGVYHRDWKEDLGFKVHYQIKPTGDVQETHLLQKLGANGLVEKSLMRQAVENPSPDDLNSWVTGRIHTYQYNTYCVAGFDCTDANENAGSYGAGVVQARQNDYFQPAFANNYMLIQKDNYIVSGSTDTDTGKSPGGSNYKHTKQVYIYDDYQNVTQVRDLGVVASTEAGEDIGHDSVTTVTAYAINFDAQSFMQKPYRQEVYAYSGQHNDYRLLSRTVTIYDGQTQEGSMTQGYPTEVRKYLSDSEYVSTGSQYDADGNLEEMTDAEGNKTTFSYDTTYRNRKLKEVRPSVVTLSNGTAFENKTDYGYDALGNLTSVTDVNGAVTSYDYDGNGRRIKTALPGDSLSSPTTQVTYVDATTSSPGYIKTVSKRDANSLLESREYVDGFGRVIQTKVQTKNYAASARQYQTTDSWHYVEGNEVVSVVSIPYLTADLSYDRSEVPSGSELTTTRVKLDARSGSSPAYNLGTFTKTELPSGDVSWVRTYHFSENRVDANGHRSMTNRRPDELRVSETDFTGTGSGTSAYSTMSTYTYKDMVKVTDADGNQSVTKLDWAGRQLEVDDADRGRWTYTYDDNGNTLSVTNAKNQVTTMTYDALNRMVTRSNNDGTVYFYYDADNDGNGAIDANKTNWKEVGYLTKVTDNSGMQLFRHDDRGQQEFHYRSITGFGGAKVTEFKYNSAGQLTYIRYPGDGSSASSDWVKLSYDNDSGHLQQIDDQRYSQRILSNVHYNARGDVTDVVFNTGGGVQHYEYKGASGNYLLDAMEVKTDFYSGSYLFRYEYDYDNVGNVTTIDALDNTGSLANYSRAFTYDELDRVTAQSNSLYEGGAESFSYNEVGNLISRTQGSNSINYSYPAAGSARPHAPVNVGGKVYGYDANGNMITRETIMVGGYPISGQTLSYTVDGKLASVSTPTSTDSYVYDYTGKRVKQTSGGVSSYYFNKYYEVHDVDSNNSGNEHRYYFVNGKRIAQRNDAGMVWFHNDHLGSAAMLVKANSSGTSPEIVRHSHYATYGDVVDVQTVQGNSNRSVYGYTGQEKDSSTGLMNYGARFYDPVIGRFIQADTVLEPTAGSQALNRYAYVANNPMKYNDPTGMCVGCESASDETTPPVSPAQTPLELNYNLPYKAPVPTGYTWNLWKFDGKGTPADGVCETCKVNGGVKVSADVWNEGVGVDASFKTEVAKFDLYEEARKALPESLGQFVPDNVTIELTVNGPGGGAKVWADAEKGVSLEGNINSTSYTGTYKDKVSGASVGLTCGNTGCTPSISTGNPLKYLDSVKAANSQPVFNALQSAAFDLGYAIGRGARNFSEHVENSSN